MLTRALATAVTALAAALLPLAAPAATVPSGFSDSTVATGLSSPTAMELLPDGRLLVAQQGGSLRVIKNNALLATPFLTVSVNSSGERGLIGVTIDPNFATNRYVYVYYTTSAAPIHNRISRFTASLANPDIADVFYTPAELPQYAYIADFGYLSAQVDGYAKRWETEIAPLIRKS